MRKHQFVFRTFALLTLLSAGAIFAHAQPVHRVWVASTGTDTGTCTRTAPCRTFQFALGVVAPGGEINAVDAADYSNPQPPPAGGFGAQLVINKAVTIDGLGVGATLTAQNFTDAIRVEAGAADTVIIRNLSITGFQESATNNPGDNGIRFHSGGALVIQNCDIHSFEGTGIIARVRSNPTGAAARAAQLAMSDVKIYNNYGYGVLLDGRDGQPLDFAIDNMRSEANGVPFGNGVGFAITALGGEVRGVIRDSVLSVNQTGVLVQSAPAFTARLHIEDSTISTNSVGLQVGFGGGGANNTVYISDNVIQFNQAIGITISGGQVISFGDNKVGPGQGSPSGAIGKQ